MSSGPGRQLVLGLIAFALGVTIVGLASTLPATRAGAEEIADVRVLLHQGRGVLPIGPAGAVREVEAVHGNLVAGRELLGIRWAPQGDGPWTVGDRTVRGRILVRAEGDRLEVLNRIDLETYVASIVGAEMSPSWPMEALRAQAVAARTYALHEAGRRRRFDWDLRATVNSQVYRGVSAESRETREATAATQGEILTYRGAPILAVFHSTAGGRTATAGEVWGRDLPYLRNVDIEEEADAPHTYWRTVFSNADLDRQLTDAGIEVGSLRDLVVTARTESGRVATLEVRGSSQVARLFGPSLRSFAGGLDLRSKLFDIRSVPDGFAFVGSGYGHGVGMSQWGARALAERGETYRRILERFYPGTRLEVWGGRGVATNRATSWADTRDFGGALP